MTKERALVMDQKIACFITRDARPISLVEGDGFFSLLKYTDPDYAAKAHSATTKLIKKRYDQTVKSLKLKLGKAQFVAFTTREVRISLFQLPFRVYPMRRYMYAIF